MLRRHGTALQPAPRPTSYIILYWCSVIARETDFSEFLMSYVQRVRFSKFPTFLQSRGNKIHTGCIYLPFNSFWHGCILAFQSIPDCRNAQAQCLCQANRTKVDQFLVLSQVKKGRKLAKPHPLHVRHQEVWEISLPCDYGAPIYVYVRVLPGSRLQDCPMTSQHQRSGQPLTLFSIRKFHLR